MCSKRAYLNLLLVVSLSMLFLWLTLDILDLYTDIDWVTYTRGYREYVFYAGVMLNIAFLLLRKKFRVE